MDEIKDKIVSRRKALGMTQEQLAKKLGVSAKVVSKWETGRSLPDTALLSDLCRELHISADELLSNDGTPQVSDEPHAVRYRRSSFIAASAVWIVALPFAAILIGVGFFFLTGFYDEAVPAAVCLLLGLFVLLSGIAAFIVLRTKAAAHSSLEADKKNAFRISVYTYVLLFVADLIIGLNILSYEGQDKAMFFGILAGYSR